MAATRLRTPEEMAAYLDAWLDGAPDDAAGLAEALGNVSRTQGMSQSRKSQSGRLGAKGWGRPHNKNADPEVGVFV
jgi:DNA-binding phage protein